ncbi:MAG: hypothetical protein OYK82_00745 [Gammaproteobacteria bacterium]|nr:hypothetical protein [Gammaproteobacteria bacterium]
MPRVTARVNSTNRKRIRRQDVQADFRQPQGDLPFGILVTLDRTAWRFPGTATIVLEVRQRAIRARFELGTVMAPVTDTWLSLESMDPGIPPQIRLKVVDQEEWPGRLLAASRFFVPIKDEPTDGDVDSPILHIRPWSLGDEIWRIEFSDDSPPVLLYNDRLFGLKERLQAGALVTSLVLPVVLRDVLREIRGRPVSGDDDRDWQTDWLNFCKWLGVSDDLPQDDQDYAEWEEGVLRAFCRKHDLVKGANRVLDAGGWR